jgi:hypothetical protein
VDNAVVAEALRAVATQLGYPVVLWDSAFPRSEGANRARRAEFADRLIDLAHRLKEATLGSEKVLLAAELATLASEDAGAVTFMSDPLHDIVRAAGMVPGTSAVLSMLVTREYRDHWKIPLMEPEDAEMAQRIIRGAVGLLSSHLDEAYAEIDKYYVSLESLENTIR